MIVVLSCLADEVSVWKISLVNISTVQEPNFEDLLSIDYSTLLLSFYMIESPLKQISLLSYNMIDNSFFLYMQDYVIFLRWKCGSIKYTDPAHEYWHNSRIVSWYFQSIHVVTHKDKDIAVT
jgi:hypothetical protein